MNALDQRPCPHCRKPVSWIENPHRPFCSERCRLIDLGSWMSGEYRVAAGEVELGDGEQDEA